MTHDASADKKIEDGGAAGNKDDAATLSRAIVTRSATGLRNTTFTASKRGYRVDVHLHMKDEPDLPCRVIALDDDFCELVAVTLEGDGEQNSVKTLTLLTDWVVHKSRIQRKVATLVTN